MKYDDASWHYGGDFPESSPEEYAATHIALIMKWCFQKGWAGEIHTEDEASNAELQKVISNELSATEFFMRWCDGKLTDEDFNEQGNALLQEYCGKEGSLYLPDYAETFGDLMYVKGENEHDFIKFSAVVEKRLQDLSVNGNSKSWWEFW